jgi:hypothetical protein
MALDVPPTGAGVKTVTFTTLGVLPPGPAVKKSAAGTVAFSCVELIKVDANAVPSHCTTEHGTNELPITVKLNV